MNTRTRMCARWSNKSRSCMFWYSRLFPGIWSAFAFDQSWQQDPTYAVLRPMDQYIAANYIMSLLVVLRVNGCMHGRHDNRWWLLNVLITHSISGCFKTSLTHPGRPIILVSLGTGFTVTKPKESEVPKKCGCGIFSKIKKALKAGQYDSGSGN